MLAASIDSEPCWLRLAGPPTFLLDPECGTPALTMAATTIEPTPDTGGEQPAEAATAPSPAPAAKRVLWRAVVRTGGAVVASRERDRVEWHLATCNAAHTEANHCATGRHLIETIGHPDGHCIIDGVCGLCGAEPPAE
jgi:hypothetical protein